MKNIEREQSKELFGTHAEPTTLASKILGTKSRTFDIQTATNGQPLPARSLRVKLTESEKKRVQQMIRNAKTMQEIARIEKELNEGRIPAGAADSDRMQM